MCQFKSGIVVKSPKEKGGFKLYMSPWTDSHHEIETIFNLRDVRENLAKVEFTPTDMAKAHEVDTYKFRIDEERTPSWFNEAMQEAVKAKMVEYITRIIVTGDVCLLIGGQFIIAPGAKVECAKACVISAMCGGTLTEMWGGTLTEMWGGTLTAMWGGTLTEMWGGTLTEMWGGTLTEMRGGTLTEMRGGTLTEIKEWFSGIIGKITKPGKVLKDERKAAKRKAAK